MVMRKTGLRVAALLLFASPFAPPASASDVDEIATLLQEFLAAADEQAAHEQFWAEDLVYTSSGGQRFGKAEILAGFADNDAEDDDAGPAVAYFGEDIDVRLYGDMAIVAFKLVGQPADGANPMYYFNTGTFLKRDGAWQVVAWQATIIPPEAYQ